MDQVEEIPRPMCLEHQRLIEYFCQDDQVSICSRCYIMGDHKDHSILSYEEKNKCAITAIENEMETATIVLNRLSKFDIESNSMKKTIRNEKKKILGTISHSFQLIHSALDHRERELAKEVSSLILKKNASIDGLGNNIKNEKQKLENTLYYSRQLLENQALVIDADSLLKVISEAKYIPCMFPSKSNCESLIAWDETHIADITEAIGAFGTVKSSSADEAIQLKTIDEQPDQIKEEDKVFKMPSSFNRRTIARAPSISSVDTGDDVIIESDSESSHLSVALSTASKSEKSSTTTDIVLPTVNKGAFKKVSVTHICSPNDFYVQLHLNKNKLEIMSKKMNIWCNKNSSQGHIPKDVEKGMLVLARYSVDKRWYRASVIEVETPKGNDDKQVMVHLDYYDFGNKDKVPVKNLRKMQSRFQNYPPFCVHCSLYDIAPFNNSPLWDRLAVQEFFKITQNQTLLLNVIALKGAIYEVDLVCMPTEDTIGDGSVSVRDMLIFMEFGVFAKPNQEILFSGPQFKNVNYLKPTAVPNGTTIEINITEANSPSDLYLAPCGEEHFYCLAMMEKMLEVYGMDSAGIYSMHCPRKGAVCACEGPDGNWYRGQIIAEPKCQEVTVFLPDKGSTLVLGFDKIKKLLSDFIKLPAQAIHCRLADIGYTPGCQSDWSNDVKVLFNSDLKGNQGRARIVRWGEKTEIVLWTGTNSRNINEMLVAGGLAASTGISSLPPAPGIASASPPTSKHEPKYIKTENIQSLDPVKSKKSPHKELSSSTLVPSPPESFAQLKSPEKKSIKQERKPKPEKLKEKKKKREKRLSEKGSPPAKNVSHNNTFNNDAKEGERRKRVQEDIHKAIEGDSGKEEPRSPYIEIIMSCFNSPSDFYIRVKDNEEVLTELMEKLNENCRDSEHDKSKKWDVNEFCAVRNPEDGLWYRGKIMSKTESEITCCFQVEFLDYGYSHVIDDTHLRLLSRDLSKSLHSAAVRCYLAGLIPTGTSDRHKWSKTATEFMESAIHNSKLYIKREGDPVEAGLPIDIIVEEEIPETAFDPVTYAYHSLCQMMTDKGLAMMDRAFKKSIPSSPDVNQGGYDPLAVATKPQKESDSKSEEQVDSGNDSGNILSPKESEEFDSGNNYGNILIPAMLEVPAYILPDLNDKVKVLPTYVDHTGVIYVQRLDWDSQISHLSQELQRVYQDSLVLPLAWSLGHVCVAQYSGDALWYRGLIEDIDGDTVKVFFMDFGNSAWMRFDKLRKMHPRFAEYSVQVYHCVLEDLIPNTEDGEWPIPWLDNIHETLVNQSCVMTYTGMREDGRLKIKLANPQGYDLASHMIELGWAVSTMDLKDQFASSKLIGAALSSFFPCNQPEIGGAGAVFKAVATEVELPNIIYLQRRHVDEDGVTDFAQASDIAMTNSELEQFDTMMAEISVTPSSAFVKLPETGLLCLGKFHFDGRWYRTLVVEKYPEMESCLVIFVDFGNSELISLDDMRSLPTEFLRLPFQGIRCHLNLLPPGGSDAIWRKNSMEAMVAVLAQKELTVKVVQSNPLVVELFEEIDGCMSLAYGELIQQGLAMLPAQIDMGLLIGNGSTCRAGGGDVDVEVEEDDTSDTELVESKEIRPALSTVGAKEVIKRDDNSLLTKDFEEKCSVKEEVSKEKGCARAELDSVNSNRNNSGPGRVDDDDDGVLDIAGVEGTLDAELSKGTVLVSKTSRNNNETGKGESKGVFGEENEDDSDIEEGEEDGWTTADDSENEDEDISPESMV